MQKHILSVLAENKSGVLSRIAGLLRRKLFNIDSLTVGRTCKDDVSRFTIVLLGDEEAARKAALNIETLVEVLSVKILPAEQTLVREIGLARLRPHSNAEEKKLLIAVKNIFHKEIYRTDDEVCVELVDTTQGLDDFLTAIQEAHIEVLEWVRSGVIAIKDKS